MLKCIKGAKTLSYTHDDDIFVLTPRHIATLKKDAVADMYGRARICLHRTSSDPVQEMIIAATKQTYVRPHRHPGKTESFHIIEGAIKIVFFTDEGKPYRTIDLGSAENRAVPSVYRLSKPEWHCVLVCTRIAVIHEIITGPYTPAQTEWASWAPLESDARGIRSFTDQLNP